MASAPGYLTATPPYFTALLAAALASLRKFAQAMKNRRDAATLAGMDERMLRDIGLTRSDLRDAYSEPLWRDPTDILAARPGSPASPRQAGQQGLSGFAAAHPARRFHGARHQSPLAAHRLMVCPGRSPPGPA